MPNCSLMSLLLFFVQRIYPVIGLKNLISSASIFLLADRNIELPRNISYTNHGKFCCKEVFHWCIMKAAAAKKYFWVIVEYTVAMKYFICALWKVQFSRDRCVMDYISLIHYGKCSCQLSGIFHCCVMYCISLMHYAKCSCQ